ncbi:plasmid pRiA4b ORF-3 family protein [Acetobacterium bakii]|uniref:TnpR protein n=1 Tax=Acetobacterium bakii TaxID=52689 RepID=A0A0L6TZQ3_9FIRM|nr:plasmid pRiA4b ORF-3 family protein [Acetobacterium bakii]KNZ41723.1 hypothetical protein AKG39_10360 [Acetobacterium bakii]
MQICCTKILLEKLHIPPFEATEENDLFCWSANLLKIKRKKAVVVVNDSNRFGFVLYGLKARDFKSLQGLIEAGIRRCLKREGIRADIIEAYFGQSGAWAVNTTRGRVFTARLSKACERAGYYDDRLDTDALYQIALSQTMNSELITGRKDGEYGYPYEFLIQDFKDRYGEKIIATEALDLLIRLDLRGSSVTRRLLVPVDITFHELHEIIQIVFDWQGSHLHGFNLFDQKDRCIVNVVSAFEDKFETRQDCPVVQDKDIRIETYIKDANKIIYTYDYGDEWNHDIIVHGIVSDYDKNYPTCIMAEGNRPPEDVGGISGFEEYLDIMSNPEHPKHEMMKSWTLRKRDKDFDIDDANHRLRYVLGR